MKNEALLDTNKKVGLETEAEKNKYVVMLVFRSQIQTKIKILKRPIRSWKNIIILERKLYIKIELITKLRTDYIFPFSPGPVYFPSTMSIYKYIG
jgi:hypothetical protein